jgi:hypothetical protein
MATPILSGRRKGLYLWQSLDDLQLKRAHNERYLPIVHVTRSPA